MGRGKSAAHVSGSITAQMLTEGIITPALLHRMHEEWANSTKNKTKKREKEIKSRKNKPKKR